jgi:hypothetical protein
VHLSKEALDLFGLAAASPKVDVIPHLAPERRTGFHQRLHNIKLFTLQAEIDHICQLRAGTNCDEFQLE